VRRSRPRFWGNAEERDALGAFRTLWEALVSISRLTAPITPFFSDWLHRGLTKGDSVHLASFPTADPALRDEELEAEMEGVRALVTLGRAAREEVRIRVRQPLRGIRVVLPGLRGLRPELLAVLKEELNVKEVTFFESSEQFVQLRARPDFRALGPRFQKRSEAAAAAIRALDSAQVRALQLGEAVSITLDGESVTVEPTWLEVFEEAVGDLVVKTHNGQAVALDPSIDPELKAEGLARELINRIQRLRKDAGLEITDRIKLGIEGPEEVQEAVSRFEDFISKETLALDVRGVGAPSRQDDYEAVLEDEIDGVSVRVALSRAG
jgi:isoleucyl-tRNA synthetase